MLSSPTKGDGPNLFSFSDKFSKPWLRGLLLGFLAFWLITPLSFLPLGKFLENRALDFCYQWRPAQPPSSEILLVGIDEASFNVLQRAWPWPRSWHARLVKRLFEAGARLVVFDIVFAEPSTPDEDQEFVAALQATGNVVLVKTLEVVEGPQFRRQILITPMPHLTAAAKGVGLAMVTPDPDGVVRRFQVQLAGQATIAAMAARLYNPTLEMPDSLSGLIDYSGPARSLDIVSFYQVIDPDYPLPAGRVRGKIVLVGSMLEAGVNPRGQADNFYTPHFSLTGQTMSGVEIQGHIIQTLLQNRCGQAFPDNPRVFVYFFIFLAAAYLFARLSPLSGLIGLFLLCGILFSAMVYLFFHHCLWFPPVLLASGLILIYGGNSFCHYVLAARDKHWLRQAFSRYVSSSLVESITSHPEQLRLGGEEVEVTILFSDLVGFTSISEGLSPENLIHLLNEYFSTMTDIILNCKGTVDKYIGDAIMAFWGAPLPIKDHAAQACLAALAMHKAIAPLQETWQERGLPLLGARLGLHSGQAIVGNVGSRDRFNYTVMGDTVNLASRLEGVNKIYGTGIIVSESTYQQAGNTFLFRELDLVQVRGRLQPVTIYELLGRQEDKTDFPWLETFTAALHSYRQRQWDLAAQLFREVLVHQPKDPPSLCFQRRLKYFQQHPPLPDWQGIYSLNSKSH
jgi:adenylate cyclase